MSDTQLCRDLAALIDEDEHRSYLLWLEIERRQAADTALYERYMHESGMMHADYRLTDEGE